MATVMAYEPRHETSVGLSIAVRADDPIRGGRAEGRRERNLGGLRTIRHHAWHDGIENGWGDTYMTSARMGGVWVGPKDDEVGEVAWI